EQPWGPPPGKPAEPEQQSSTMQGNPWAQSDDDSGWYTGAAPVETTQTQDVAGSDGEDASQWSQPQWNSSIEPASNQNDGFQSGGWAAVEEKPEPEPYTSAPPSPFAAPATVAEYESNSESIPESIPEPAPSAAPTPPPGWTALEPAQAPAPAPATGWGAPESAQTTGWAAPDQEPAPSWPPAPDLSSVPESASESAPTWPQAPEALPQPQPEPAPAPAPVFQSIPVSAAAPSPLPSPAPDQSVQQQPAPVPDPKKGEESEEDYTYDPTTAWG
ncbi:MAG: hypothetical protein KC777_28170, partial [Cyanobacteria bacterium HKST-UBA02]|nr:hypothetical protein [Cyanobacteria bacterium HKST-UBA02]